eukprot:TRINITY_DN6255_c0_g2_i1.p1 TRINITY_DN6255_c0_g2~~TRINITY_DN6255_c0_g2_i1.p1  ORF type:complete len:2100 (+),score=564.25 TRINITY_DN6255_c0_g2_i1:317-6616(+)
MDIAAGSKARLRGLQGREDLNGAVVQVATFDDVKQRWRCILERDNSAVNVKPDNLEPMKASEVARPKAAPAAKDEAPAGVRSSRRLAAVASKVEAPAATPTPAAPARVLPAAPAARRGAASRSPAGAARRGEASAASEPAASAAETDTAPASARGALRRGARGAGRGRGRGAKRGTGGAAPASSAAEPAEEPGSPPPTSKRRLSGKQFSPGPRHRGEDEEQPPAKTAKRAASAPPSSSSRAAATASAVPRGKRTVEQIYQKKTQLEHILLRPDSYVGSMERQVQDMWVLASVEGRRQMVKRCLSIVPALYKIFDEILVNACDNLIRDPSMNTIRITIDEAGSSISVWNNGAGVPVEIHKEHKCYVPEMIFGQLLTSDNYDDSEKKVVGGRNGYGAKLTNIFSTSFTVETVDSKRNRHYKQTWQRNMTQRGEPIIKPSTGTDFTCVTFQPDFGRFGMEALEKDIVDLMKRRAYDAAASTRGRCHVELNGELLEVASFPDYIGLYLEPDAFRVCETLNERWEVGIALVPDGSGFQQVSFVNSICTTRGGTHVDYIANQLVSPMVERFAGTKGDKGGNLTVKPAHVRNHLMVFVNCLIENPAFDSQTKDTLTSKKDRFGSTCVLPEEMLDSVLESGIMEALKEWSKALGKSELAKHLNKSGYGLQPRLFGIPKLEDANRAGTKDSSECTLIITEGDSAKALAVAGLAVVGRDHYGVFPLRGKLRNVRELSVKQMMENKEIEQLSRILALDASKNYESTQGLRYGSLMIMTDQDFDGSHIKGLVLNFIQHCFPGLFKLDGFMKEFVTPIVKATKGDEVITFLTLHEYEEWKKENDDGKGWKCKYYKGLGTSTSVEAREYFTDLDSNQLTFQHSGTPEDDNLMDMAFSHSRADDRKEWIAGADPESYVDHTQATLSYSDFVNKELVHFAKYDVGRMIPSLVDGLKPGQRKVIFGAFKKNLKSDIKVAQLSGYVAEKSAYHHGETSLQGTIIGLAQSYVGSNNINLLVPSGQFGTRLQGGKDHAAARYIFTRLAPITRHIFPEDDDGVLEYLTEEGMSIEPRWYCPVLPMVLVNGADGIGVGWATTVPNYNPRDLIKNIRRHLRKEPLEPMLPWFRGFKGTISPKDKEAGKYESVGVITRKGRTRVEVTELPVRRWTQDYKDWLLEQLPQSGAEKRASIVEFREHHTENTVHFFITMTPDKVAAAERMGVEKFFKLRGGLSSTNMVLFDSDGKIKKYDTPEDILVEFAQVRLDVYEKRKAHNIKKMEREVAVLTDKAKFIKLVVEEKLIVEKRKAKDLCVEMREFELRTMRELDALGPGHDAESKSAAKLEADKAATAGEPADNGGAGYNYLLSLKMWTLTEERMKKLLEQAEQRKVLLEDLRKTPVEELWERDLQRLESSLDSLDKEAVREQQEAARLLKKAVAKDDDLEDGMTNRQCVLVVSDKFEVKRVLTKEWKAKRKGGRGQSTATSASAAKAAAAKAAKTKAVKPGEDEQEEEEEVDEGTGEAVSGIFPCREFEALILFTEHGHAISIQALDIPVRRRVAVGMPLSELVPGVGAAEKKHRLVAVISVPQEALSCKPGSSADGTVLLVSGNGWGKELLLSTLGRALRGVGRRNGWVCVMPLEEGDELCSVQRVTRKDLIVLGSSKGFVLCFEARQGFPAPMGLKSKGKQIMKLLSEDRVAACAIANLGESSVDVAKKPPRVTGLKLFAKGQEGMGVVGAAKAWNALSEEERQKWNKEAEAVKSNQQPAEPPQKKARTNAADDDDSGEGEGAGGDEALAEAGEEDGAMAVEEADGAGQDEEEDEPEQDDDGQDDADDAGENAQVEDNGEASAVAKKPVADVDPVVAGQTILLVTRDGLGKRVPLSDFRAARLGQKGWQRRNQRGKTIMRQKGDDELAALQVVTREELPKQPPRPRDAAMFFLEDLQAKRAAAASPDLPTPPVVNGDGAAATNGDDAAQKDSTADGGVAENAGVAEKTESSIDVAALWMALPEAEKDVFEKCSEEAKKDYKDQMEKWRALAAEMDKKYGQILLCTQKGLVSRVMLAAVVVSKRGSACRSLMTVRGEDGLLSASLISALDEDDEEGAEAAAAATAATAAENPA